MILQICESGTAVNHHKIEPNRPVNTSPISNRRGGGRVGTLLVCRLRKRCRSLVTRTELQIVFHNAHREKVVIQPHNFFMARQIALPPTLAPRLIGREAAAAYLSVSPTTFDEMVKDGRMPRPKKLGERRLAWDVRAIDLAVDLLPVQGDDTDETTWSDVDNAT
jgi:predicted DNA-binding transcriptional regulator AlpA